MSDIGYENLAIAIVKQWSQDYKKAINKIMNNKCGDNSSALATLSSLKRESESQWFAILGLSEPAHARKLLRNYVCEDRKKKIKKAVSRQKGSY